MDPIEAIIQAMAKRGVRTQQRGHMGDPAGNLMDQLMRSGKRFEKRHRRATESGSHKKRQNENDIDQPEDIEDIGE